jgi:hypothetical protein
MKIIAVIRRSPAKRYRVDINDEQLQRKFKKMISARQYSKAMVFAFTKGKFCGEVSGMDLLNNKVDLILTEHAVSWDLTK